MTSHDEKLVPCPHCDGTGNVPYDLKKLVGFNVKRLRKAKGMNQEELASKTRVSRSQIANIEGGRSGIMMEHLPPLSEALECSIDTILIVGT